MQGEREMNGAIDPVVKPFVDFWSDYFAKANSATRELIDGSTPSRKAWTPICVVPSFCKP
jgi:thiamine biosynthesis lipoprotein ApbE